MAEYLLTADAEDDLFAIAAYTLKKWGPDQLDRYEKSLETHLRAIASGDTPCRTVFEHRSDIFVSRCEHHYVFHVVRQDGKPLILAVFHENMDLMRRLQDRLNR